MNQCDGCRARKPLTKSEFGGYYHVMGEPGKYADLQGCTADRYGYVVGEKQGEHTIIECPTCGKSGTLCCDEHFATTGNGNYTLHQNPSCLVCCEHDKRLKRLQRYDGIGGYERSE